MHPIFWSKSDANFDYKTNTKQYNDSVAGPTVQAFKTSNISSTHFEKDLERQIILGIDVAIGRIKYRIHCWP